MFELKQYISYSKNMLTKIFDGYIHIHIIKCNGKKGGL